MTYRAFTLNRQVFTSSGTYTPTVGMVWCDIECIGGGGAGGSAQTSGAGNTSVGAGGGGGEYARGKFSASTIGISQSVTIGAAGIPGSAGNNPGGGGGTTSVGSTLISAVGGSGGIAGTVGTTNQGFVSLGGTGGIGGDFRTPGYNSIMGFSIGTNGPIQGTGGGNTQYGSGGLPLVGTSGAGNAGLGYGSGGGGGVTFNSAQVQGGAGTKGIVIITEYIIK